MQLRPRAAKLRARAVPYDWMVKRLPLAALIASLALVIAADYPWGGMTDHSHWTRVTWIPFETGAVRPLDVAGNLLLCAPLGAIAGWWFPQGLLAAAGLSLTVSVAGETLQVYSHGRYPSGTDVFCNVVGAMMAAQLVRRNRPPQNPTVDSGSPNLASLKRSKLP